MIDLGLSKLAVIGVVALIVIGPERLPKVARMAGTLFGRAQRYINEVKSEVSREIELEELRNIQKDVQEAASHFKQSIDAQVSSLEGSVNAAWHDAAEMHEFGAPLTQGAAQRMGAKAKDFRKKKVRMLAAPTWYKKQHGVRVRIMSGAARVAKYRPSNMGRSAHSFHQ